MTAAEAFADLYRTLPRETGESWLTYSRQGDIPGLPVLTV
jgi:hypothetical protein